MKKLLLIVGVIVLLARHSSADTIYIEESQLIQVANDTLKSTVLITSNTSDLSHGSGFYVSENEIITNYHVIKRGQLIITTHDKRTCSATVKYQDDSLDLALLTTDCTGVPLELTEGYSIGQTVITVGNPSFYEFIVTRGVVSGEGWRHILFDAPIELGSSGGAIVNIEGKVIGVVKAVDVQIKYIGYAIPVKEVNKFLQRAS